MRDLNMVAFILAPFLIIVGLLLVLSWHFSRLDAALDALSNIQDEERRARWADVLQALPQPPEDAR